MPNITAGRPADADKIHSYDDLVALHHRLAAKAGNHDGGTNDAYGEAAERISRLAALYRQPETLTSQMRTTAETVLAAVNKTLRSNHPPSTGRGFAIADTWLDHLSMLIYRPTDGR